MSATYDRLSKALREAIQEEVKIALGSKTGRAPKAPSTAAADSSPKIDGRTKEGRALKAKLDGRSKEARAAKAATKTAKIDGRTKEGRALKAALKGGATAPVAKKIDGRSKEARAAKAAAAGKAPVAGKPAKAAKATKAGKIDGRTKEGRALKAAAAGKGSTSASSASSASSAKKIDGRTKEGRALKAAAAANGKPGPKKGKKAEAKAPAPKKSATNATEGRRAVARGDRPTMKEAIATVMGKSAMGSADIVAGLEKKGWLPNAQDPQQYVSYLLSSNKDVFERIERGQYKVREGAVFSRRQMKLRENGESEGKGGKKAAAASASNTEAQLAELGVEKGNVASNPFG